MNSIQSTGAKLKPLVTRGSRLFLVTIFSFGFLAPFIHIPFNNLDVKGLFGFKSMASFLFAIGFPALTISTSVLLYYSSKFMPTILNKKFRLFSLLISFIGFYFLIWAINPYVEQDFPPIFYYGSMIMISILLSYSLRLYSRTSISALKSKIRYIMSLMVDRALENDHIKDEERYEKEIIYPALDKLDER